MQSKYHSDSSQVTYIDTPGSVLNKGGVKYTRLLKVVCFCASPCLLCAQGTTKRILLVADLVAAALRANPPTSTDVHCCHLLSPVPHDCPGKGLAPGGGIEPPLTDSKSAVLPLDDPGSCDTQPKAWGGRPLHKPDIHISSHHRLQVTLP